MLDISEAQQLIEKFIALRSKAQENGSEEDEKEFKKHEKICIEKFQYLVTMKLGRYKTFSNYEDIKQEGFEALIKSMKNYDPKKGNFFWWSHRYIDTRIARSANLHTTIRYPLRVAKNVPPHKETIMPVLVEERFCPDKEVEVSRNASVVRSVMSNLNELRKEIIGMAFGFDGDKSMSVNKICKKLGISRLSCVKTINHALSVMKENIKL